MYALVIEPVNYMVVFGAVLGMYLIFTIEDVARRILTMREVY